MERNQSWKGVEQLAAKSCGSAALAAVWAEAQVCRAEQHLGHVSLRCVEGYPQTVGQALLHNRAVLPDPLYDLRRIARRLCVHALG